MINFTEDNPSILFIGEGNKFYYPLNGARIGAMHAYFELDGITANTENTGKQFKLTFGEDPTGIYELSEENDDWYDLDGRKLARKPAQRGVYVNEGRKVIVK